jgi:hypothetical protein
MVLTKEFRAFVKERADHDPAFRTLLLKDGITAFVKGDVEEGRGLIRSYINATIGFQELAECVGINEKSLMRMFGANGNPTAKNLGDVLRCLIEHEGADLDVRLPSAA